MVLRRLDGHDDRPNNPLVFSTTAVKANRANRGSSTKSNWLRNAQSKPLEALCLAEMTPEDAPLTGAQNTSIINEHMVESARI